MPLTFPRPDGTSAKINAIRAKNGNLMTQCPLCCQPAASPFRVFDPRGKVTMGCIDAFHTGHLPACSESSFWHNRKISKDLRKDELKRLTSR